MCLRRDLVAISSPMGGDKHKQELKQELDQKQNAGAEARALDAVEAHNAVQLMARAKVAQRGPASMGKRAAKLVEVPVVEAAPLVADAVVELAPGEARVREAIEAAMAIIGTDGQPERTLSLWRTRLRARLVDDGVTEQAVARRLDVVKAAWASLMVSEWHIANGCATRSHFFVRTTRSAEKLEAQAARIADAPRPLPRFRTVGASAPDPEPAFTAEDAARAAEEDDEREFQRLQAKAADDRARLESQRAVVPAQSGPTASSEKMAAFRAAVGGLFGGAQ